MMQEKRFAISEDVFAAYPDYMVGVLVCKDVVNHPSHPDIATLLREGEVGLKEQVNADAVNDHPTIAAWRAAHKQFGSNPKDYPPSVLAVAKRIVKGGMLPSISSLVDLYNYIGMKYVVSVGGEDVDTFKGDMVLEYAKGDEPYFQIGSTINEPPTPGEVVYKDSEGVICRRFNWRECDRTKITTKTSHPVLLIEAFSPTTPDQVKEMLDELHVLVERYCGGTLVTKTILDKEHRTANLG